MNKRIQSTLLIGILLYSCTNMYSMSKRTAFLVGGATVAGIVAAYFPLKKTIQTYIENTIHDKAVEYLIVALTRHETINALPEKERVKKLRQKAWLVQMRTRVLEKLDLILEKKEFNNIPLSKKHHAALVTKALIAQGSFAIIDGLRKTNVYEKEYQTPSYLDGIIEQEIIRSIISSAKPENECSIDELAQRAKKEESKNRIIDRALSQLGAILINKIQAKALLAGLALNP